MFDDSFRIAGDLETGLRLAKKARNKAHIDAVMLNFWRHEGSNMIAGEKVYIADNNNGERFETYIIKGERGSGKKMCIRDRVSAPHPIQMAKKMFRNRCTVTLFAKDVFNTNYQKVDIIKVYCKLFAPLFVFFIVS